MIFKIVNYCFTVLTSVIRWLNIKKSDLFVSLTEKKLSYFLLKRWFLDVLQDDINGTAMQLDAHPHQN
jgi:hypothetical protein